MVDTLPLALVSVGSPDAMLTAGVLGEVTQAVLANAPQSATVGPDVQVACHYAMGICRVSLQRVNALTQAVSNGQTEGTAIAFATITAGGMDNKDVKSIAISNTS